MQAQQNPYIKCPECGGDRGIYMTAGPAIYNMTHQPGCNLNREFNEWVRIKENSEQIENLKGNR